MTEAGHPAHDLFDTIFTGLNTVFCTPHKRKGIWAYSSSSFFNFNREWWIKGDL